LSTVLASIRIEVFGAPQNGLTIGPSRLFASRERAFIGKG
jgi:hypothetical protein